MSLEKLKTVSEILEKHQNLISFDGTNFVATGNISQLEKECKDNGLEVDKIGNTLTLTLSSLIPSNLILFDELSTYFEPRFVSEEFFVIKINGEFCFHNVTEGFVFNDSVSIEFKNSCENIFYYYKLYNFIKTKEISDHHDSGNKEFVIYNSAKGIFKVVYEPVPIINNSKNISVDVNNLIKNSSSVELNPFFKNALSTFVNGKPSISLQDIISNSDDIVSTIKRDYALVSKQFNFEKIRDSLYKEKEKYFTNIRDIANKIFSQAIGIPISISATVFATYKVSDDTLMLLIVWLAFILYAIFYVKIQLVYRADIEELKTDFNNDFEIIKTQSGLSENIITTEKTKIDRKISSSLAMINSLVVIVICLGLLVSWYIFYEVGKSEAFCLIKLIFGRD